MGQLNKNPLAEVPIFDFSGGQASAKRDLTRAANEFKLINNWIILPQGAGLRNKPGNQAFNASAIASTPDLQGLGYLNIVGTGDFLVTVAGGNIYRSTIAGASFSSITGGLTVTADRDNLWQLHQFNNVLIGVGGAPNAPFKVSNTGDATALGGTPPSTGTFGFAHANRFFIGTTHTLYYSVLSNHENWTGDGSGSLTFGLGDGSKLVTGIPLDINSVLIFKESSVYIMTGRSEPFPSFKLFDGIGCAGKNAAVVADGVAYWVTADGRMAITDGEQLLDVKTLPALRNVSDEFGAIPKDRLPFVEAVRHSGIDFDWIIFSCNKNNEDEDNDFAIIWDLNNKCFLTADTGFNGNCFTRTPDGTLYMGGYDGKVYECLVEDLYTEASEAGANVSALLRSDALNMQKLAAIIQVVSANLAVETNSDATITFRYGYDGAGASKQLNVSLTVPGSLWGTMLWGTGLWSGAKVAFKNLRTLGRGNYFRYEVETSSAADVRMNGLTLYGRQQGTKNFEVK